MGKRLFDISPFRSGGRSENLRAPRDNEPLGEGDLFDQAIGELSALTLDEMSDALRSLDGGAVIVRDKQTFTLEEIYGSTSLDQAPIDFVEEKEDSTILLKGNSDQDAIEESVGLINEISESLDLDEEVNLSEGLYVEPDDKISGSLPDYNQDAETDAGSSSPVSGLVKDELVLSLLQSGVVTMSQVFDAIRHREEGMDLWRVLAEHPETNTLDIQTSVAQHQGYAFQPYLDAAPTRTAIDDMLKVISPHDLGRLLSVRILPVGLDLDMQTRQYSLIVLSGDPLDARVQAALLSCPVPLDCRFSPASVINLPLGSVTRWMEEKGVVIANTDVTSPSHIEFNDYTESGAENGGSHEAEKCSLDEKEKSEIEKRIHKDRVVRCLLAEGTVTDENAAEAIDLFDQEGGNVALWRILADIKGVSREAVYETCARVYAFKLEAIGEGRPDHDFVRLTMETLADEHREEMMEMLLVPFEHSIDFESGTGRIIFVTPDPTRPEINRLVHDLDLGRFELRYASETQVLRLFDEIYPRKNEFLERITEETDAFDLGMSYDEGGNSLDEDALEAEISRSKLINLFEAALVEAVRQGCSDIHIYPNPNRQVEIHFRTDGRLKKWHTEDKIQPEAFLAVVKDNSTNVDRFERDAAQDGFIQRDIDGALIRFRVSILPIASANQEIRAESIVIRILDDRKVLTDLTKLGMLDVALERFNQAIRQPHGMVIVTGPTGSGKSTTLVAALYQVITPEVNVLTVEDPVEYIIRGVRQIKLSHKLDLEGALRAILRHDPDIVMVGEMRDKQSAELAIKLANTGHLTFSTLHTNDAPAAVSRLYKMGVEPFLIAYAINLVVAQRLIREVCPECKIEDKDPDTTLMKTLGWKDDEIRDSVTYKANVGSACSNCGGNGYKGRRAVCETLYFTRKIRAMIAESGEAIDEEAIRRQGIADGMLTLQDSAKELVKQGATTMDEMLRVSSAE